MKNITKCLIVYFCLVSFNSKSMFFKKAVQRAFPSVIRTLLRGVTQSDQRYEYKITITHTAPCYALNSSKQSVSWESRTGD